MRHVAISGVILAAGRATRIMPLSRHTPKPLLPVGNRPIIAYQIDQMRDAGVANVHVVVGPLKEQIIAELGDGSAHGVSITYAEQREPLGIAHALAQVAGRLNEPFFVFLGDIFSSFTAERSLRDLTALLEIDHVGAVLTVKREAHEQAIRRNFAVHESGGLVTRVVEKPTGELPNDLRGCGIYLFRPSFFEAIDRTPRSAVRGEYEITDAIQCFIDSGERVRATSLVDWDMNVTFPADLLSCNLRHLLATGRDRIVGRDARLHPDCEVHGSVIGDGVVVRRAIRIIDSLVLHQAQIDSAVDIERTVVGPADTICCPEVAL
ncbi:MAG TPA: sugar phosphate nucleotidyltransferase [Coriobacteriia bacterium]